MGKGVGQPALLEGGDDRGGDAQLGEGRVLDGRLDDLEGGCGRLDGEAPGRGDEGSGRDGDRDGARRWERVTWVVPFDSEDGR